MKTCSIPDCGNLVEGRTDKCASHNHEQRRAERNSRKIQVVQPVKKVSAKMAKDLADYGVLKRIYLKENPECEVKVSGLCNGIAVEIHHAAKRGQSLLQADTFRSVCRPCHVFIETKMSAEERREKGFLITKNHETV